MTPANVIAMPSQRRQCTVSPSTMIERIVAKGTLSCTTTATTEAAVKRDADEHQAEVQRTVEERDQQHVAHAAGRGLQERDQYGGQNEKAQAGEEQRRHLADAHLGRNEIEAPDHTDQDHEQEMPGRHRAC